MRITFELILGAVLAASLLLILGQTRRIAEYQRRQDADALALRMLNQALRQRNAEKAAPPAPEEEPTGSERAVIAQREAVIARLDRELAETHATIADLQTQLTAANDQNAKAQAAAEERLQKQQTDSQAQMDDLQKKLDAALAQVDIARQRSEALEADNAKLKADSGAVSSHANDEAHIIASLQDLDVRREAYLTSILRRYRDITGEFRAMTGMLDTNRDASAGPCSSIALGRIQNAVTSAEDDLRQISELNARSQKLEKQLLKK